MSACASQKNQALVSQIAASDAHLLLSKHSLGFDYGTAEILDYNQVTHMLGNLAQCFWEKAQENIKKNLQSQCSVHVVPS